MPVTAATVDHRHAQFLGQRLEAARDLADLLLAAFDAGWTLHQLQVVHHDEADPAVGLEPARLRSHLEQAQARSVVDVNGRRAEDTRRAREAREIVVAEHSLPQPLRVDARFTREHALHERFLTHFEREERNRNIVLDGRVLRDVEHERGLSHRRSRRDDDEVGRLETRRQLIHVLESARHTGDGLATALERFDALHRRPEELLDAGEPFLAALLRDLEDLVLGVVEQLGRLQAAFERLGNDRRRHFDEAAEECLLADDARVILDVRRRRHGVDEEADVVLAARRVELTAPLELIRKRERIDDLAALGKGGHRAIDAAVPLAVEHSVVDGLDDARDGVRVHEHGREHRLLGVLRVRRPPIAVRITPEVRGCYRVFDGRAGHRPRLVSSTPDYGATRRDGRSR